MKNDSGARMLLIVLIVSAFLLLLAFLVKSAARSCREKRPVSPYFYRAKRLEQKKRGDPLLHMLAPSVLAICICAVCLCGASWAWFTASTATGTAMLQGASYKLLYQAGDADAAELTAAGMTYSMSAGTCRIKLTAAGTAGAVGYCSVQLEGKTYYTQPIFVDGDSEFTFTVHAAAGTEVVLTPQWGSCAVRDPENTVANGGDIGDAGDTGAQQSDTQAPDNAAVSEPALPDSIPAESGPVDSLPAPSEPESDAAEQTASPAEETEDN